MGMVQLQFAPAFYNTYKDSETSRKEDFVKNLSLNLILLLEASLSDTNSVVAAEKDVAACVSIIASNPLGSIPTGVVLFGLSTLITRR